MWLYIVVIVAMEMVLQSEAIPCEEAQRKCAFRIGCGMALQNYMMGCSSVLQGDLATYCPENCQNSLIALTSTEEGEALMNCECSDDYCRNQKARTEICRPVVLEQINQSIVSCSVAQWICAADAQCSTALEFYNRNCKAMFHGRKCTPRCQNSIQILERQEKAHKLAACYCEGTEDYDCRGIRHNTDKLCFHKHRKNYHKKNHTHIDNAKEEEPSVTMYNSAQLQVLPKIPIIITIVLVYLNA